MPQPSRLSKASPAATARGGQRSDAALRVFVCEGPEPRSRSHMNPILKAHRDPERDEAGRAQRWGRLYSAFRIVDEPAQAEVHTLPVLWDQDVRVGDWTRAFRIAEAADKPVLVFGGGDFERPLPGRNGILLHPGLERSRRRGYAVAAVPYFFDDILALRGRPFEARGGSPRPLVGFCGQGASSMTRSIARAARKAGLRLGANLGRPIVPPPLWDHVRLRQKCLRLLERSDLVDTAFVVRARYRAGLSDAAGRWQHPSTLEFEDNILETDYTLCVRGSGNFSARFYETLCLGRIPIFVDTDCVLPLERKIRWKEHCVWVDRTEVDRLPEIVAAFHAGLGREGPEDLQRANRELWLEHLRLQSFFAHMRDLVECIRLQREGILA